MASPAQISSIEAFPSASLASSPNRPGAPHDSRGSFLRMVSHELRTPLNSIIGFSEILSHELCGPLGSQQYVEYAGLIGQSGHRLLKLVNQILDIVRLEGNDADLDITPEAVQPIIEKAIAQVREEAETQGVVLRMEARADLPDAMIDARAMLTATVNLLQNAIVHSHSGGEVTVRVTLAGAMLQIEVEDHGVGLDPEQLPRILRPFEQGEHALTRRSQGAGLGLPIVRLLTEAMGGRLELWSQPGQGFTARILAPTA